MTDPEASHAFEQDADTPGDEIPAGTAPAGERFSVGVLEALARDFSIETALRDIKAELCKVDERRALAELVRDVISLANTARRRGERARIIFGISETPIDEQETIHIGNVFLGGVQGQYIRTSAPPGWMEQTPAKQADIIDRELHAILRNYITPEPDWAYLAGEWSGRLVAYIEIMPSTEGPYRVGRELSDVDAGTKKRLLEVNDCWTRSGSSKQYVDARRQGLLYCWRTVPYVPPERWSTYAQDSVSEFGAPPPQFPIPLTGTSRAGGAERPLSKAAEYLLADPRNRVVYVTGGPGSGKTTFLKEEMYRLSRQLSEHMDALRGNLQVDEQPQRPIPVWLGLNNRCFSDQQDFAVQLADSMDQYGTLRLADSESGERIFADRQLSFVLLLDALDELDETNPDASRASLRAILRFLENHANVRAIITSRPSGIPTPVPRGWTELTINRVAREDLKAVLYSALRDSQALLEVLESHPDLLNIVSVPLALEAMVEYARRQTNAGRPITLAGLLSETVDTLFWHESQKDPSTDRNLRTLQRIDSLAALAWWMDGKLDEADYQTAIEKLGDGDTALGYKNAHRINEMGVLQISPKGCRFSSEVLKLHFAARRLHRLIAQNEQPPVHEWVDDHGCRRWLRECARVAGLELPPYLASEQVR